MAAVSSPSGRASGGTGRASARAWGRRPARGAAAANRSSVTGTIISRLWNCGSATMSAMLLIRLTGIRRRRRSVTTSSAVRVAVHDRITSSSSAGAADPALVLPELGVVRVVVPADGPEQAAEQGRGVGRDADERAVGTRVGVRRRRVVGDVADPLADRAGVAVLRQDALQHAEHGLGQGDVHDLAAARRLPLVERDERADERLQRRDRVAQAQPHAGGRAVRLAGQVPQPARGLGDRAEARLVARAARSGRSPRSGRRSGPGSPPSATPGPGSRPRACPAGSSR